MDVSFMFWGQTVMPGCVHASLSLWFARLFDSPQIFIFAFFVFICFSNLSLMPLSFPFPILSFYLSLFSILCSIPRFTVAVLLKDDYYVRGAGLPGRFKAEKVEFHWGQSNASEGSEHSINGHRFPVEVSLQFGLAGKQQN